MVQNIFMYIIETLFRNKLCFSSRTPPYDNVLQSKVVEIQCLHLLLKLPKIRRSNSSNIIKNWTIKRVKSIAFVHNCIFVTKMSNFLYYISNVITKFLNYECTIIKKKKLKSTSEINHISNLILVKKIARFVEKLSPLNSQSLW